MTYKLIKKLIKYAALANLCRIKSNKPDWAENLDR